jgi:methylenetetrahydrofolate reductase (NADPH)
VASRAVRDGRVDQSARLLARPRYEVIPVRGIEEKIAALPPGSLVTVTASPAQGLARTMEVAERLRAAGHEVVPHLAARMLRGRQQLEETIRRCAEAGVTEVFVVGGDASPPAGIYTSAGDLLEDLAGLEHPFARIGIGGYPEGHPLIDDDRLFDALLRKQPLATHIVTQLCFEPAALAAWLRQARAAGITLPVIAGLPGVVERRRLAEISLKTGVGASLRYLRKNRGNLMKLARTRRYDPTPLLRSIAALEDARTIAGIHLFTFNQLEATVAWVQSCSSWAISSRASGVRPARAPVKQAGEDHAEQQAETGGGEHEPDERYRR